MSLILEKNEPAINRGIKTVGVGKKGSKNLNWELAQEIVQELKAGKVRAAAQGAFFAGLFLKGITQEEMLLDQVFAQGTLTDPEKLVEALAPEVPSDIKLICTKILQKQELNKETAYRLGQFLFSDKEGDGVRGLVASALRVRYETPDEYAGLLLSMQETINEPFRNPVPLGDPIIQLAEPFDGVDQSYLITPLITQHIQNLKYRVIHLVGRNSGPKNGNNSLDLAQTLSATFAKSNSDLVQPSPKYGWHIRQTDLSKAIDRWVEIRRQTIKRPFLATLEKFLNPADAKILITSAFHPPYSEKMTTVAENAGFLGSIVVRNGLEGTIAFPLKRSAKILCSARQQDGNYVHTEIDFDPVQYLGVEVPLEEKLEKPSLEENARLIKEYQQKGKTANELFDHRVKVTCAGLERAIEWVENKIRG